VIGRRMILAAGAAALARPAWAAETPLSGGVAGALQVLTYHRFEIRENPPGTVISPGLFAQQMDWLASHPIPVAGLRETLRLAGGETVATPAVAITADDGWRTVYTEMFPVILKHRFPVTLFLNPPMIGRGGAYLTWPMVMEMKASGLFDIQAHTLSHPNFNEERHKRAPDDYAAFIKHELADCRAMLEDKVSARVDLLAWPFGIHNPQLEQAAADAGYVASFALGSKPVVAGAPMQALPRSQIYESDGLNRFAWMAEGHSRTPLS
jgi:peptidoglycan/xylan/chitin deacetylase (PgdA/CDA1 family)